MQKSKLRIDGQGDALFETVVDYLLDMSDCSRLSCERMAENIISMVQKLDMSASGDECPSHVTLQTRSQTGQPF